MAKSRFKPRVLAVDHQALVPSGGIRMMKGLSLPVREAQNGHQALEIMAGEQFDIVLLDEKMARKNGGMEVLRRIRKHYPDTVVIMIAGYPTIENAVESMKAGAMGCVVKAFRADDLEDVVLRAQETIAKKGKQIWSENREHRKEFSRPIIGKSPVMQKVIATIRRVAATDSTVLITGETGTGKELAARAIHDHSARADNDFVPVECSALVESLLESELFGHVKGAFTNAHEAKNGLFELANFGTFFFDEISNLSLNTQAKLLRVIQEREYVKVGGRERRKLDIRFIAASNGDLKEAIKSGTFREDLYFRLNVVPIHMPPLRERSEDIGLLVEYFVKEHNAKYNGNAVRGISKEALEMLMSYPWPGNVRELEHLIERVLVLEDCHTIRPEHLPTFITQRKAEFQMFSEDGLSLQQVEKRYLQYTLRRSKGRRQEAADILGINRKTLAAKIKKYGLKVNL